MFVSVHHPVRVCAGLHLEYARMCLRACERVVLGYQDANVQAEARLCTRRRHFNAVSVGIGLLLSFLEWTVEMEHVNGGTTAAGSE